MSFIRSLFRRESDRASIAPLYRAVVERARAPHWFVEGAVPDTMDGRFDMVAAVLALVLVRLEADPAAQAPSTHLAEAFVDDMDAQLRELGVGDVVVGKRIGQMMGALGGRLTAYRAAIAARDLTPALGRNLYRGEAVEAAAVMHAGDRLLRFSDRLGAIATADILAGRLPPA